MASRKAGARHRVRRVPPAILTALALAFVPATAHADPVPPRCEGLDPGPAYCVGIEALRVADRDHAVAVECPVQLRVAEQRLAVAAGDALVLSRALESQSVLVGELRRELRAASAWGPRWAWYLLGAGSAVVAGVVLALSL